MPPRKRRSVKRPVGNQPSSSAAKRCKTSVGKPSPSSQPPIDRPHVDHARVDAPTDASPADGPHGEHHLRVTLGTEAAPTTEPNTATAATVSSAAATVSSAAATVSSAAATIPVAAAGAGPKAPDPGLGSLKGRLLFLSLKDAMSIRNETTDKCLRSTILDPADGLHTDATYYPMVVTSTEYFAFCSDFWTREFHEWDSRAREARRIIQGLFQIIVRLTVRWDDGRISRGDELLNEPNVIYGLSAIHTSSGERFRCLVQHPTVDLNLRHPDSAPQRHKRTRVFDEVQLHFSSQSLRYLLEQVETGRLDWDLTDASGKTVEDYVEDRRKLTLGCPPHILEMVQSTSRWYAQHHARYMAEFRLCLATLDIPDVLIQLTADYFARRKPTVLNSTSSATSSVSGNDKSTFASA